VVPKSPNFGFLGVHADQLVMLGALAERYFRSDPNTALIKLRQFAEVLAQCVAAKVGGYRDVGENQSDLLRRLEDRGAIPREAARLFHDVRRIGNKATHDGYADHNAALSTLKLAWQLGVWFHRSYGGAPTFQPSPFAPPPDPRLASVALRAELERLRAERAASLSEVERAQVAAQQADEARLSAEEQVRREAQEKADLQHLLEEARRVKMRWRRSCKRCRPSPSGSPRRLLLRSGRPRLRPRQSLWMRPPPAPSSTPNCEIADGR
jgi:type I restriction enzyme R subunit